MPFPVDESAILSAEKKLGVRFPEAFRVKMMSENGGELKTETEDWLLHPFFDTSSKKRLKRTCNDIVRETASAQEWYGFPGNAIAIGTNGCGDQLVFLRETDGSEVLSERN